MLSTKLSCLRLVSCCKLKTFHHGNEKLVSIACKGLLKTEQKPFSHLVKNEECMAPKKLSNQSFDTTVDLDYMLLEKSKFFSFQTYNATQIRHAGSYFQKNLPPSQLWKQVTSVSAQGKKRGRAKGLARIKNLNRGQRLGWGREKIRFPGLTDNKGLTGRDAVPEIGKIEESEHQQYLDGVKEIQDKFLSKRKRLKKSPLERGWVGGSPRGKKFGPPEAANPDVKFDNFESILVEYRQATKMSGKFGRIRGVSLIMLTGNRNGSAGWGQTYSPMGRGPGIFQKAANRAGLRLCNIPRYEDRTVYHDFFTNFGETRITVLQKPRGYGVTAHRLIVSACELIGIKDLYAKVEGSMNYNHILKAFFLGLLRQRTHQELANEMRLHLVEFRKENHNFPRVVASPEDGYVRTKEEILPNEILDFQIISFDGNVPNLSPPKPAFFHKLPSWTQRLKKVKPQEHHLQHRINMEVEHGRQQSQYTDIFPECKAVQYTVRDKIQADRRKRKMNNEDID